MTLILFFVQIYSVVYTIHVLLKFMKLLKIGDCFLFTLNTNLLCISEA